MMRRMIAAIGLSIAPMWFSVGARVDAAPPIPSTLPQTGDQTFNVLAKPLVIAPIAIKTNALLIAPTAIKTAALVIAPAAIRTATLVIAPIAIKTAPLNVGKPKGKT